MPFGRKKKSAETKKSAQRAKLKRKISNVDVLDNACDTARRTVNLNSTSFGVLAAVSTAYSQITVAGSKFEKTNPAANSQITIAGSEFQEQTPPTNSQITVVGSEFQEKTPATNSWTTAKSEFYVKKRALNGKLNQVIKHGNKNDITNKTECYTCSTYAVKRKKYYR